jgi:hypothetical protein
MWIIPMCKWILTKSPRIPPRSRPDWRVSWSKRCRVRCRATHLYVRRECTQWCMVIYLIIYYEMKLLPNPRSARMNAAFGKTNIQISYTFLNKELRLFYVIYKTCVQKKEKRMCDYPKLYLWDWSANQHRYWEVRAARKPAVSVLFVLIAPSDRKEFDVSLEIHYWKIIYLSWPI